MLTTEPSDKIAEAAARLISWLEDAQFQGWDPHDALNSPFLARLARRNRWLGIALVQAFRRSPINLRGLFRVSRGYNPKGMGLFLASFARRYACYEQPADLHRAHFFADWLRGHVSPGYSGACWGYNFHWPNRAFAAPEGTPTVVNTAFIAQAFSDAAEILGNQTAMALARSACDFVAVDLNRQQHHSGLCFSYTPLDRRQVHNANLLAAALLVRVGSITREEKLVELGSQAAAFSVAAQLPDGTWPYGVGRAESWVDNFHTGFVLVALADVAEHVPQPALRDALERGYAHWKHHFFRSDGAPKYYPHKVHPIDVHSVAQAALTFLRFRNLDADAAGCARRVLLWGIDHMQDRQGYFYYQVQPLYTNRIPYVRWSQAWMLRALSEWLWVEAGAPGEHFSAAASSAAGLKSAVNQSSGDGGCIAG